VSTDKAVNPKNIMGITKSLCEKVYQSYFDQTKNKQKFIIIRFGNVAGSKGSVLPFFQKLINKGLPLPVTSKKATRYLMSIREASNLIIKASVVGLNSKTYVLDMGVPINIYYLAYKLIKFNGLSLKTKKNIQGSIAIKVVGLKKGEKLHEKLTYKKNLVRTDYYKIFLCDEDLINSNFKYKIKKYLSKFKINSDKKIHKNELLSLLKY
jgi:FlaA1/EpsC-like NDP-sugar epimerase